MLPIFGRSNALFDGFRIAPEGDLCKKSDSMKNLTPSVEETISKATVFDLLGRGIGNIKAEKMDSGRILDNFTSANLTIIETTGNDKETPLTKPPIIDSVTFAIRQILD